MAAELFISLNTVKKHVRNILGKRRVYDSQQEINNYRIVS
ncbi:MAG: hypothetical protein ABG776_21080 [Cyanobacteria bacterium J06555_13]